MGYEIYKNGGWLNHLENKKAQNLSSTKKQSEKEDLENQVLNLRRDNLRLKNWDIRFRWLIALGSFVFGFILKYILDINN